MQTFLAHFCNHFWHSSFSPLFQTFLAHFCQTVLLAHFFKHFGQLLQKFLGYFYNALAHFCVFGALLHNSSFGTLLQTFLAHFCQIIFFRTFSNIFGALLQIFWSTFAEKFWHTFANFLVYFWPTLLKATQIDSLISRLVMASKTFTNVSLICIHLQRPSSRPPSRS